MCKKTVSVIVPAFNAEKTLRRCVDSLLAQTLPDMELILVNDGSADQTGLIIEEYAQNHPQTVIGIQKENGGVSSARNAGLEIAQGEYIGFADADDSTLPDMFALMYQKAQSESADLVQCWYYDVLPDGNRLRKPDEPCTGISIYQTPEIVSAQTFYVWDKIYRRETLMKHKIRFENFRYAEDCLFNIHFELYATGIVQVEQPLYLYTARSAGAATTSFGESLADAPRALARVNELVTKHGCFSVMEPYLWDIDAHSYLRRLEDFFNYDNKELQREIARGFFELLDRYFPCWREDICRVDAETKLEFYANRYRSDWNKLMKFIRTPRFWKRLRRKTLYIIVRVLRKKNAPTGETGK